MTAKQRTFPSIPTPTIYWTTKNTKLSSKGFQKYSDRIIDYYYFSEFRKNKRKMSCSMLNTNICFTVSSKKNTYSRSDLSGFTNQNVFSFVMYYLWCEFSYSKNNGLSTIKQHLNLSEHYFNSKLSSIIMFN